MVGIILSIFLGYWRTRLYWPLVVALVATGITLVFLPGQMAWWKEAGIERDVGNVMFMRLASAIVLCYIGYGIGRGIKRMTGKR